MAAADAASAGGAAIGTGLDADAFRKLYPEDYFKSFLEDGIRPDGRVLGRARPTTIGLNTISSADGSALVKQGETTVCVAAHACNEANRYMEHARRNVCLRRTQRRTLLRMRTHALAKASMGARPTHLHACVRMHVCSAIISTGPGPTYADSCPLEATHPHTHTGMHILQRTPRAVRAWLPMQVLAGVMMSIVQPGDGAPDAGSVTTSVEVAPFSSADWRPGRAPELVASVSEHLEQVKM